MSLHPTERRRYARHTLLPEIGVAGQERLCAATVVINSDADPSAAAIARDYLARAGVNVDALNGSDAIGVATNAAVDAVAPASLRHAAASLAGAFAAVETIKALVGAGAPAVLPTSVRWMEGTS